MRKLALALATGAVLLSAPAVQASDKPTPEARRAKILEGRVAGEPVDCIFMPSVRNTQIIDKTAIVYDAGSTIYVNRPASGAESLDRDSMLVTRLTGSQLCSIDTVHLRDRSSHFWEGFVGLGKFVPYTRAKAAKAD
ncbi:MAG: hypothetical protein M0R03_07025 [Novosphingobium sp.]|nr:hypothetical protein [Novosphingobium sp.]